MLQSQHPYQSQYNQQPDNWQQHGTQHNNHQGLNHAQQQAHAAQQHYTRIAVNQNNNSRETANNNQTNSQSLAAMNEQGGAGEMGEEHKRVLQWVADLMEPSRRETALMELSKKREQVPELALVLWHSFGVMTSLLQEIISVYPLLNPSQLTAAASNRVCNALALLQCVASHNETRGLFLNGTYHLRALTRRSANEAQLISPSSSIRSSTRPQNPDPSSTSV
jgi:CCR4-NOT transcription complex subunit 9